MLLSGENKAQILDHRELLHQTIWWGGDTCEAAAGSMPLSAVCFPGQCPLPRHLPPCSAASRCPRCSRSPSARWSPTEAPSRGCALGKELVLCSVPEICWGLRYIVPALQLRHTCQCEARNYGAEPPHIMYRHFCGRNERATQVQNQKFTLPVSWLQW